MEKTCKGCGAVKPLEAFNFEPRNRDHRTGKCSECLRTAGRAWYAKNPERMAAHRQRYRERHAERDKALRAENAKKQNEKRREERALARLARGLPLLPSREPRWADDGRLCSRCRRRKPSSAFTPQASAIDGLHAYCRECSARYARERLPKTIPYRRAYMRRMALAKYGLTEEDFAAMKVAQEGRCAICGEVFGDGFRDANVDHDHITGVVRGILCRTCNAGLGQFKDKVEHLGAAIRYLNKHQGDCRGSLPMEVINGNQIPLETQTSET